MDRIAGWLAAATTAAAAATGCAAPSPGGQVRSAQHAALCVAAQLGAAFTGSAQPGTSNTALAIITIWDASPKACMLPGRLTVTGVDSSGHPRTAAVRFGVAPGPALTPRGAGPDSDGELRAGEVSVALLLIAAGTRFGGSVRACRGHHADPAEFWVTLASGWSVSTRNASSSRGPALTRDGGLLTCRGQLGGQSPVVPSS